MTPPIPFKTINVVDDASVDAYIQEHLGRPWSLQQNSLYGQETLTSFEVYPDPDVTAIVEEWLASPPVRFPGRLNQEGAAESVEITTDEILRELCNRGLLPEEDLWVNVWW